MQETTSEGIVKGDVLQRLAGASLIVGGIVLIVFNVLFPRVDDPDDKMMVVQIVADNNGGFYELTNLLLAVGFIFMMIGITGIYRSISVGGGAAWVRLGFYGVIMGTTLWTVTLAVNGLGLAGVVADWEEATGASKDTLFQVASAIINVSTGLFALTTMAYWTALVFVGIGMSLSTVYARWLGLAFIAAAAPVAVYGIALHFVEQSRALDIVFAVLALLSTLVALATGIWISRKAW